MTVIKSAWHRIGARHLYRFKFNGSGRGITVEWSTSKPPKPREIKKCLNTYRAARDVFLLSVAKELGIRILCVEAWS